MKKVLQTEKISDAEANEIFKEFTWSLAGIFHNPKPSNSGLGLQKRHQRRKTKVHPLPVGTSLTAATRL